MPAIQKIIKGAMLCIILQDSEDNEGIMIKEKILHIKYGQPSKEPKISKSEKNWDKPLSKSGYIPTFRI